MRLSWTSTLPEDGLLRQQWNALVLQMEKPEVFYTWEWASAFVRSYGDSVDPWIATAYEGNQLVGVAAFARMSAKQVCFLSGTTADYCDFVSTPPKRREFVAAVLSDLRQSGIATMVLANLPAESATVAEIRHSSNYSSFLRMGYICAQVQLGSEEEKQALKEALFKKKMLRRSMNGLQRIGPVTLQHDLGSGLERGVIERFCKTHVARFLATGRISNLVQARRRAFLRELATLLAERGWFDLSTLRAGKFVVGVNYGFRFQGSRFWYQPTIVNKFEEYSPGSCLLAKIVEDACEDPNTRMVDLGLGAEEYKGRFANAQRTTLHATLTRKKIDLWKVRARYHTTTGITKVAYLERIARRAQTLVRGGKKHVREDGFKTALFLGARGARRLLASADQVLFFQWTGASEPTASLAPQVRITWEVLAEAAIRYCEDAATMDYLLRSSPHLRSAHTKGFAISGADGVAEHFAWVARREAAAASELKQVPDAQSPSSVLIIDCWTPRELLGRGLHTRAIRQLAETLSAEGNDVWIASPALDSISLAGIQEAGFQKKTAISRRKILGWNNTRIETRVKPAPESSEVISDDGEK
jgi:CelD/BcsL family acetyltransferase involved in cellulose biosynthesis